MGYLTIRDVALLDSACTNNIYRHLLLDKISNTILIGDMGDEGSLILDVLQWLVDKRIYVKNLFVARVIEATDEDTLKPNMLRLIRAYASKIFLSMTKHCEGLRIADRFIFESLSNARSKFNQRNHIQSLTLDFELTEEDTNMRYSLVNNFPTLKSIEFQEGGLITDAILTPIVSSCPGLQTIKVSWKHLDNQLTDASLIAISNHCPGLQTLHTVICPNIQSHRVVLACCICG